MGTCEMCGQSGTLKETRVEGAQLSVCGDCQDLGELVEQPSTNIGGKQRSSLSTSAPQEDVLPGYNEAVKQAREGRGASITELAEALKEKESVVRRIEAGKLTPDRDLARKFERELGIDIYGDPPEEPETEASDTGGERTVGDVADVKKG